MPSVSCRSQNVGEHIGLTDFSENVSERNNTLQLLDTNNETRNHNPDELSKRSVPGTHFHRQPHTHHTNDYN